MKSVLLKKSLRAGASFVITAILIIAGTSMVYGLNSITPSPSQLISANEEPISGFSALVSHLIYGTLSDYYNDMRMLVLGLPELVADAGGPYIGTLCDPIQFDGDASGGSSPYTYLWDFGDGNTSTEEDPEYQYTTTGIFDVMLTVTDDLGNSDDDTTTATVTYDDPVADANGPYSGTICEPIHFTGSVTGGCTTYDWFWQFGDGVTCIQQNPSHQYTTTGTFYVTLTVTDDLDNSDDDNTWAIVIYDDPVADANGPYSGTICESIEFNGDVDGGCSPYEWYWDFGDGETSTERNPEHQYEETGTYDVILTVTDDLDNSDDESTTATVIYDDPVVNANGPYSGISNATIQFTGSVTGGCPDYSWYWDFGDGNTSNEQNPTNMYTYPDNYTMTLTVTDEKGNLDTDKTWADIKEEGSKPNKPIIDGPTTGKPGNSYPYTFTSTDPDRDDVSYYIKWGDDGVTDWTAYQSSGTPGYSESHTWDEQKQYTIEAKAKDINGLESNWATLTISMSRNRLHNNIQFLRFLQTHLPLFPLFKLLLEQFRLH